MWVQQRQLSEPDEPERNVPSAILLIVFIIIVVVALPHPRWYFLRGGKCSEKYIGLQPFYFSGNMDNFAHPYDDKDKSSAECVSPNVVNVHRCMILLCFLAILSALTQFFFDILGVRNKHLLVVRRNAVTTIVSVVLVVIVIGLCYYAGEIMKAEQEKTKLIATISVEVDFSEGYYMMISAGVIGVIAVGTSLLHCYSYSGADGGEVLLDDSHRGQDEIFSVALPHSHTWTNFRHPVMPELPPPPPYTP